MIKKITILTLSFLTFACAPGLGSDLRVDRIKEKSVEQLSAFRGSDIQVHVGSIVDARSDQSVGKIDGRTLNPSGNVSVSVKRAIERHLTESGVRVSQFNAPTLKGEIRAWQVNVQPGFPSTKLESNATLELTVYDQNEGRVYGGIYSGNALNTKPFFSEAEIEDHLGEAMGLAIREALGDEQMILAIRGY